MILISNLKKNNKGVSLMELIVSIGIIIILTMGIYNLILFSLKITADNKSIVEATEIVNQKMEQIRNMAYIDVGTLTGSPIGTIPEYETVSREHDYTLHTMIMFYDDPYDGTVSDTDSVITDYKIATVDISWQGRFGPKNITIFSKIIPNTEETLAGYGLLKLYIIDANGGRVPNANIHIENAATGLSVDLIADNQGELSYPVLPGIENYEITVTKANYGTDQTHDRDAVHNPQPTKPHLSVFESTKTEESFTIDKLAVLNIQVVSNTQPIAWPVHALSNFNNNENVNFDLDASNNIFFAWQSKNATSSKILIQKFNSSDFQQWPQAKEIETTNYQENPDIVTDNSGNIYLVWQDNSITLKSITFEAAKKPLKILATNKPKLESSFNFFSNYKKSFQTIPKNQNQDYNKKDSYTQKIFSFLKPKKSSAASSEVSFVSAAGNATGNNSYITINLPAGTQENDFLLAYIFINDASDGPIEAPAGWNILNNNMDPSGSDSDSRGSIFWKIATDSEPANYTFYTRETCSLFFCYHLPTRKAGHIRSYRNVNLANPFHGTLQTNSIPDNSQIHTAPSHDVGIDGSMLVCGWSSNTSLLGDNSPVFPATQNHHINNFTNRATAASSDKLINSSESPSGTQEFNANQNVEKAGMAWSLVLNPVVAADEISVSSINNQIPSITTPQTAYLGGTFVIAKNNTGDSQINKINITETGTIDEENDLGEIKLYYDLDTTAPYDCVDESYDATEPQFGATTNFNNISGTSTFSSTGLEINQTKTACFYTIVETKTSAVKDSTIEISIANPNEDIVIDAGSVIPNTAINIASTTKIKTPTELEQIHYRWQNDDNSPELATWLNDQNTPIQIKKGTPLRIRIEIANNGSITSSSTNYQLEYGKSSGSCAAISTWTTVATTNTVDWKIFDSTHLLNGTSTTNIANGLIDAKINFVSGEIMDTSNTSSNIFLGDNEFTELLYSIEATDFANDSVYCFRVTNNGDTNNFIYSNYPQINIVGDSNIYIKKLSGSGNTLWATKKVNAEINSSEQINPQIAFTDNFGTTATSSIIWEDNRNGNLDIYLQLFQEDGTRFFANDIQITSSSTDEYSAKQIIDNNDDIIIVWVENDGIKENIYVQKYNSAVIPQWPTPKKIATSSYDNYNPSIISKNNELYFSWTETKNLIKNIYLAKFDTNGNQIWKTSANLDSQNNNQYQTDIFIRNSNLFITWTDDRFGNEDIFVQKYDLDGNAQWANDLKINITMTNTNQKNSKILVNSTGKNYAVWQSDENGFFNIYASEFVEPSAVSPISGVPITITGTKQIGNNPIILEYNQEHISDASGEIVIPLEWDNNPGYNFQIGTSSALNIVSSSEPIPLEIAPAENKNIILYVE